ncbi:MAG: hypothetical protein E6H63_19780, partial [Betaproteobacteria bacterium]
SDPRRRNPMQRRNFLQGMTALGAAAGLPLGARAASKAAYDPSAKFELRVSEVPFRKNSAGRQLMARIYQPQGAGPFATLLDLHGGAWQRKDRKAEEPMDRAIAASGVLVVAIDMTISGEAPYPACPGVEGRFVHARHLRQLERRPRRRAHRHAAERCAL